MSWGFLLSLTAKDQAAQRESFSTRRGSLIATGIALL
jgi:hypothetical protein